MSAIRGRLAAAATLAIVLSVPGGPAAAVGTALPASTRTVCTFDASTLPEISGIALSRTHRDLMWATNDSGGGPYLYAIDLSDCHVRATLHLLDTPARDHEALAVGRDARGRDVIWIGDIGDNSGNWPYARIHKVIEPRVLRDADVEVTTYRFTYPEGPTNAEALLADPDSEHLWVISKEFGVGGVFALPSPMDDSQTPMRSTRVGDARSLITDAAMAPDGTRYVVRDYLSAEVFQGHPAGASLVRFGLPIQAQGESVTWTADGRGLLIASEGDNRLIQVDVPDSAFNEDASVSALPRVAGFDVSTYARWGLLALTALVAIWLVLRARRRRANG